MIEQLQIIKPKRVKETLNAFLLPDYIVLEFGITKVVVPCKTGYATSVINHKELYSYNFESANQIDKYVLPDLDLKYEECIINAPDRNVFSAFSDSGDDEYFFGIIKINSKMNLELYGFTYFAKYESAKMRNESTLEWNIDYQVYYYLFQMFKGLSGKKTSKLLWATSGDNLFLTDENKTFYVISSAEGKEYRYKTKYLSLLSDVFNKDAGSERQLFKNEEVMPIMKGAFPMLGHLGRPLDGVVYYSIGEYFHKLRSGGYVVCLMKPKM